MARGLISSFHSRTDTVLGRSRRHSQVCSGPTSCLDDADLCVAIINYPAGEKLYILKSFGSIQFVHGDRPQELYGLSEACLVLNLRFGKGWFVRTNGVVSQDNLMRIVRFFQDIAPIKSRHKFYLARHGHIGEVRVGSNQLSMELALLEFPHPVFPLSGYPSLFFYHHACHMMGEFQIEIMMERRDDVIRKEQAKLQARGVSGPYRLTPEVIQQTTVVQPNRIGEPEPTSVVPVRKARGSSLNPDAPVFR